MNKHANTTYHMTGVDRGGKRFKIVSSSRLHALGINLWCGSVWQVVNNKRKLLRRVYN